MILKTTTSAAIFFMTMSFASPLMAQSAQIDMAAITDSIEVQCAISADACDVAVAAAIAQLIEAGVSGDGLNVQLGVIGASALVVAQDLIPSEKLLVAAVFTQISETSTNQLQKTAFANLASSVATGSDVNLAAVASTLSPN